MTTAKRRAALQAYLVELRDLMRLQAWDIEVIDKPAERPDSVLELIPHEARHLGTVRIGDFFDVDRQEQRQTAVHELVHLIQAGLWEYFDDGTATEVLRPTALEWISERVRAELEIQADAVARLLAPHMPDPPRWP